MRRGCRRLHPGGAPGAPRCTVRPGRRGESPAGRNIDSVATYRLLVCLNRLQRCQVGTEPLGNKR